MKRSIFYFVFAAFAMCFLAMTSQASAQATRTWVSGVGDDANPCSRTAPCKTFPGAVSKTADCGEIDALDPGGFGTVTLTKGIKIDGGGGEGGMVASILAAGTVGVTINNTSATCPWDVLRNLDINGAQTGTIGINMVASGGTLALENIDVEGFTQQCIKDQPTSAIGLTIYNSNFERCSADILAVSTSTFTARVVASNSKFSKSQAGHGVNVGQNSKVSLVNCDINNNVGGGVLVTGATAFAVLQHDQISNNQGFGVHATSSGTAYVADNSVTFNNGTGLLGDASGQILSWGNNWVAGNSPDGGHTGSTLPPL